jgi:hypothetical protein
MISVGLISDVTLRVQRNFLRTKVKGSKWHPVRRRNILILGVFFFEQRDRACHRRMGAEKGIAK